MSDEIKETRLQAIERRRAERRAEAELLVEEQAATDLEAIDALEAQHGCDRVKVLVLPFVAEGLPVRVAVRVPEPREIKRFRDSVKPKRDGRNNEVPGDQAAAAEALGTVTTIYPERDVLDTLCEKLPALRFQLGQCAINLSAARDEAAGNG